MSISSASSSTKLNHSESEKPAHLFVLIHGLWGGPNHMLPIENSIRESLGSDFDGTNDEIVVLRPSSFRFWKTYDGLKFNSEKVVADIFYEIETLKQKQNLKVNKISVIGYSLGGLISRYVIGLLYDLQFFDVVQPIFFSTFATPHVGVEFFKDNLFDKIANRAGKYLFGPSGQQLFLADSEKILLKMSEPDSIFFKGLAMFEKHILLANIRNDRAVAFFTSYITEYSPFEEWDTIKIEYLEGLPRSRVGKAFVKPKVVDLFKTVEIDTKEETDFKGNVQEATSILRTNKFFRIFIIVIGASFLIPIWIPLVLSTSFFTSIYSMIKIKILNSPNITSHWERVKKFVYENGPINLEDIKTGQEKRDQRLELAKHESFKGDTSELTENTMENILYAEQRFIGSPTIDEEEEPEIPSVQSKSQLNFLNMFSAKKEKLVDIKFDSNDESVVSHLPDLVNKDTSKFPVYKESTKLNLKSDKLAIITNLNKINWIKLPIYLDSFNAHEGIVARRGEKKSPKGSSTIYYWASILRNHLKEKIDWVIEVLKIMEVFSLRSLYLLGPYLTLH